MSAPLLHLITTADWRSALSARVIAAAPGIGFVHLSTPDQVALPATLIFAGRGDVLLLVLDVERLGVEVRFEPGVPGDPASMLFPHAYGPVPVAAVLAALPYRPGTDGSFDAPALPAVDAAGRLAALEPSLVRRGATSEIPVTGGVAALTSSVPASYQHNQLLIDGEVDAAELIGEADRTLGGAGLAHRRALLIGDHLAATAAGLARCGWEVEELVGMAAPAGGIPTGRVEQVDLDVLRPMWNAMWRRDIPGIDDVAVAQLSDRHRVEEALIDLRCLAVRETGTVVASCLLKIDGATALLDAVNTDPAHRGRGHGDALVAEALALAGAAGADLVGLQAVAGDWPRRWYARLGFADVATSWTAGRP